MRFTQVWTSLKKQKTVVNYLVLTIEVLTCCFIIFSLRQDDEMGTFTRRSNLLNRLMDVFKHLSVAITNISWLFF